MDNGQWTIKKALKMLNDKGQIILILILLVTVALAIGIAIVQKSLVDVSTSSKVEQSSRAFSAAEAGIEKALSEQNTTTSHAVPSNFFDNSSKNTGIVDTGLIPAMAIPNNQQVALEFLPLAKEGVAQVWFANYSSLSNPPEAFYNRDRLDIYWGTIGVSGLDKPALEIKIISYDSSGYHTKPFYLDSDSSRSSANNFTNSSGDCTNLSITTNFGINRQFLCKTTLTALPATLMLMRIRLLYSTPSQPIAVQPTDSCPGLPCESYSIPPQKRILVSTGTSGETQRRVQVFQENEIIPPFFDYAIFSAGDISK